MIFAKKKRFIIIKQNFSYMSYISVTMRHMRIYKLKLSIIPTCKHIATDGI